ncbi:MAG: cell division protein FtsA [Candidatus Zixiibacteriota bacterium]|nr:MAG: cell division protein FtsA [candidate division Zixibacteria bacterium]
MKWSSAHAGKHRMATENIIAALDIGTTKIVCLVGEMDDEQRIYVIGHGEAPAEGLKRGIVVDMEKTVGSIRRAVDDAQMISGTEIDRVTAGIAGEHIRSINSHGVIAVSRSDQEITAHDVRRAIDAARAVAIPVDRETIHVIPQNFSVDDQGGIKDPVGMSGVRLELEAHIVTASVTSAKNIYRALERCHLSVDHMVLESLALSQVLLTDSELELGVIVVDVGGDITNMSVFYDGAIRYTGVISLGAKNVTSDIAIGLRTSVDQAERLKTTHGAAVASMADPEEMVTVAGAVGRPDREVSRNVLASIIEPRMEEIFSLVMREIKKVGITDRLAAGIVLAGGGSLLPGAVELAEQIFDMQVRTGRIERIEHIPDELDSVRYATVHGLLRYGFQHEPLPGGKRGRVRSLLKRFENWITRRF